VRRLVIRRVRWALAALMMLVGVTAVGLAGAAPASATGRCATPGHAYLTQPGRVIFSGFEGNQQFGVPTQSYVQFTQSFRVGGNGIMPGQRIQFDVVNSDTGAAAGSILTRAAGSNCVVAEEGTSLFTYLAPGNYQVRANYFAGNSAQFVFGDVVTNIQVQPQPYAPPPVDPDPCSGLPAFLCGV
jgi:hypothetical protein